MIPLTLSPSLKRKILKTLHQLDPMAWNLHTDMTVKNLNAHHWMIMYGVIMMVRATKKKKLFIIIIAYEYEEIINYGSLTGRRQVKTYILNMTSQHWLTEGKV